MIPLQRPTSLLPMSQRLRAGLDLFLSSHTLPALSRSNTSSPAAFISLLLFSNSYLWRAAVIPLWYDIVWKSMQIDSGIANRSFHQFSRAQFWVVVKCYSKTEALMASPTLYSTSYLTLQLFLVWIPYTSLNLKSGNGCCFCMAGLYQRPWSYWCVPCPLLGYVKDECLWTKRSRPVVSQH